MICLIICNVSFAQTNKRLTVSMKDRPLKEFIAKIEKETPYTFLYSNIDVERRVTVNIKNGTFPVILNSVFTPLNISYEIRDKRIILKPYAPQSNSTSVTSQENYTTVNGIIVDQTGQPLIGATIKIEDSQLATASDINGKFNLKVPVNSTIRISYLGFNDRKYKIGTNSTNLKIALEDNAQNLQEVVVVGYGVQKKSVVTAAISSVKGEQLEKVAPTRIDNVLQGMASGVNVTQASGQPGDGSQVRIRGIGTINDSNPLYIVDGMPIEGGINFLNPTDIASVEVLKDAASAAIYGARGANGVILITTKKGKAGTSTLTYSGSVGWQNPWHHVKVLNASQYAVLMNEMSLNDGGGIKYANPYSYGKGTDWQDAVFNKNALITQHQIAASGGSEKINYYLSFGYFYQEGIVGGNVNRSNYERYSIKSNSDYTIIKAPERNIFCNFKIGVNISYSRINSKGITTNSERGTPLGASLMISPLLPVYATDGEALLKDHPAAVSDSSGRPFTIVGDDYGGITNPVAQLYLPGDKDGSDKIVGNFWGEIELYKNLKFKSSYGGDLGFWSNDGYQMPYYLGRSNFVNNSSVWSSKYRSYTWLVENTLSYNFKIKGANDFTILLGQSAQSTRQSNVGGTSYGIRNPDQPYIDATDQDENSRNTWGQVSPYHKLASYFGRISYNYNERYMVEATMRRDGSSNFGPNNKWATFPSVSLGWNLTNEPFMSKKPEFLNSLKIRASWGKNGNESIGQFQYTSMISGNSNYLLGLEGLNQIIAGATPNGYSNPNLKWEESEQYDAGFDATLFNGALHFNFDWYTKRTNGMLMTMSLPQYIGDARPMGNVGDMQNSGLEFDVNYKFKINDATFSIGGNATYLKNKLIKLGNDKGWQNYDNAMGVGTFTRAMNGEPFPYFYGWKTNGIFQTKGQVDAYVNSKGEKLQPNAVPGDVIFVDYDGNGVIDEDDRTKLGKGTPDWTFGLNLSANWHNFDFSVFFYAAVGGKIYDVSHRSDFPYLNMPAYMMDRWYGPNTSNKYPRLTANLSSGTSNNNWRSSDLYIHDGNYLRCKSMQLGYTIPLSVTSKFYVKQLRVYFMAENLFTLTKYQGFDPEISSGGTSLGVDRGIYPQSRTLSVGGTISF